MDRVWKPEADAWPKCGLRMGSVAPYELTGLDRWNMESYFSLMDSVDGVVVQVRNRVVQDSEVAYARQRGEGKRKRHNVLSDIRSSWSSLCSYYAGLTGSD
jgi:hypothetical protein